MAKRTMSNEPMLFAPQGDRIYALKRAAPEGTADLIVAVPPRATVGLSLWVMATGGHADDIRPTS
jgi:hypothetical protein